MNKAKSILNTMILGTSMQGNVNFVKDGNTRFGKVQYVTVEMDAKYVEEIKREISADGYEEIGPGFWIGKKSARVGSKVHAYEKDGKFHLTLEVGHDQ